MITWVTVWVLTVSRAEAQNAYSYQLSYATQSLCEKQRANHVGTMKASRCDFQQIPIYTPKK